MVEQNAANDRLWRGIRGSNHRYKGLEIVTITAAKANALKNGDIINHTMYPDNKSSAKKNTYSTTRLKVIWIQYTTKPKRMLGL